MPQPLDLAVAGNGTIAALIDRNARVSWLCWPRLDGDPVFCSLMDGTAPEHGFAEVDLVHRVGSAQRYRRNTAIVEDIWESINRARILIADLTGKNPNVFYEVGIAHTVGKEVILTTQNIDDVPFDLRHLRHIQYTYTPRGMEAFEQQLRKAANTGPNFDNAISQIRPDSRQYPAMIINGRFESR